MNKLNLFIFLFLLTTYQVSGQWTSNTAQNTVVRDSAGTEQATPLIASLPNGNTYVSWFDMYAGNYQMRMQLLDANGYKLWDPAGIVVCSYPQNSALYRYDLKADNEGNAIVAFQDMRFGSLQVVAYKVSSSGSLLWGTSGVILHDTLATEGIGPAICVLKTNDIIVAWNADNGSAGKWVAFREISASGLLQWAAPKRINDAVKKYSRATMVPSGPSDFIMAYVEEVGNFPGVTSTIYCQRFDLNGNGVWTMPLQVSTNTTEYFFFPKAIPDDADGFYLAFDGGNPSSSAINDVWVQHVSSAGLAWSTGGTEAADSLTHKLTGGYNTGSVSTELWVALRMLNSSQGSSGIYVQKFDAAGNRLLGNNGKMIDAISPDLYQPQSITSCGNGMIIIYKKGGYGAENIYAMKIDYNGTMLWNPSVMLCSFNSNKDKQQTGNFASDQLVTVWSDDRIDNGIYAQNITSSGGTGITTAIGSINDNNGVRIFPNPGPDLRLYFQNMKNENTSISVFDINGKCLAGKNFIQCGNGPLVWNPGNPAKGVYFVRILTMSGTSILKWVKD